MSAAAHCLPPKAAAERAAVAYRRRRVGWLADPVSGALESLAVSLQPPTEARVHADFGAVVAWARTWQGYSGPGTVVWERRRWTSYGTQDIPVRLVLTGSIEIATAAGTAAGWRTATTRMALLMTGRPTRLRAAAASSVGKWESLKERDFERLLAALTWLTEHPGSGWYIRQLPIPGVDTKWISGHRGLLETLLDGVRGDRELGVRSLPRMCRIAVCDRSLLPGAPRIFDTSLAELAELDLSPSRTLILENKEGLHALPDLAGTVALHGGGYAVHDLAGLGWVQESDVDYWGDLDSHGFAILDRLRHHLPDVRSLLMDAETVVRWRELAVEEPSPTVVDPALMTDDERTALELIREGNLRLEQERIPWPWVLDAFRARGYCWPVSEAE